MSKNKKIIIWLSVLIVLVLLGYLIYVNYIYPKYFYKKELFTEIEQQGLSNFTGVVDSVEGDNLRVTAQVPEEFTPFSKNGYRYIDKELLLKTSSTTEILFFVKDTTYNQLNSLSEIKPRDSFTAVAKENIMDKNELNVVQITFYR